VHTQAVVAVVVVVVVVVAVALTMRQLGPCPVVVPVVVLDF
jgi:hypothetical protein